MNTIFNEREFLKDILDEREGSDDQLLGCNNYYKWIYLIAKLRYPLNYAEIGTYRGYSAYSVLKSGAHEDMNMTLFLIDNESYDGPGSLRVVSNKLRQLFPYAHIVDEVIDTSKCQSLNIYNIDMFYVDGDHSYEGCVKDLQLAQKATLKNGVIIVDDMKMDSVRKAVTEFAIRTKRNIWEIDHFRGMAILSF